MSYGSAETNRPSYHQYAEGSPADAATPAQGPSTTPPAAPAAPAFSSHLLERLIEATRTAPSVSQGRLSEFLREPSASRSLELWLGHAPGVTREQVVQRLNRDVAYIDRLVNEQVNAILHHPRFQKLEASWRGLEYLVGQAAQHDDPGIKVRVLNATWRELENDFDKASDYDNSQLFRKVYDEEFGMPGGEPYGVLLGDFQVHPRPTAGHPHDDIGVLTKMAQVAAGAFCPFITSVAPSMFGLDDFAELEPTLNHEKTFAQQEYLKWRRLRDDVEDARFLGLVLPRVLMRRPYADDGTRIDRFRFREEVEGPDRRRYLWGNPAYAFGSVLMRTFADSGWLADIRGVERNVESRGLVTGLPVHCFSTDKQGVAPKSSTDVIVTDELEKDLSDLGFISLCDCQDTEYSAFYSNPSVQKPKKYDRAAATANARMSAMLQYMFCVSRFAHYIKVIGRDKVGSYAEAGEFEQFLNRWIIRYVNADSDASPQVKARYPLREARVEVTPQPGKPGSFQCVMHLLPHYELDEVNAAVRVVTELAPPRVN